MHCIRTEVVVHEVKRIKNIFSPLFLNEVSDDILRFFYSQCSNEKLRKEEKKTTKGKFMSETHTGIHK